MQLNKVYPVKTIDRVAVELGETVNKIFDLATDLPRNSHPAVT